MWRIAGHEEAVTFLEKSIEKDMLSHAYLLIGPSQVGKMTLAMNLACAVNCLESRSSSPCGECTQCYRIFAGQHPDIQIIKTEAGSRTINLEQVRDIQHSAMFKPYEGKYRVFIFEEASSLNDEASNNILKLLEEPPESVLFILLTSQWQSILPTISSRCHWIRLNTLATGTITEEIQRVFDIPSEEAEGMARLSNGRIGWALNASGDPKIMKDYIASLDRMSSILNDNLEDKFAYAEEMAALYLKDRNKAFEQLNTAVSWWRDLMVLKNGDREFVSNMSALESLDYHATWVSSSQMVESINNILETIDYMEANVNPRLALECLMLSLPRRR